LLQIYREKAEQRQQATQLAGKDEQGNPVFSVRQNFAEPKGKAIDQFAKTIHSTSRNLQFKVCLI